MLLGTVAMNNCLKTGRKLSKHILNIFSDWTGGVSEMTAIYFGTQVSLYKQFDADKSAQLSPTEVRQGLSAACATGVGILHNSHDAGTIMTSMQTVVNQRSLSSKLEFLARACALSIGATSKKPMLLVEELQHMVLPQMVVRSGPVTDYRGWVYSGFLPKVLTLTEAIFSHLKLAFVEEDTWKNLRKRLVVQKDSTIDLEYIRDCLDTILEAHAKAADVSATTSEPEPDVSCISKADQKKLLAFSSQNTQKPTDPRVIHGAALHFWGRFKSQNKRGLSVYEV